ncbi:MAG: helix-turn-helix transcriptional regulator [Byssovorax sp.]
MDALHIAMAAKIRSLASQRGVPITHLPDRAGVGTGHFWRVLNGTASPTVAWLESIAAVLEVEVADLVAMPPQASGRLPGNP